MDRDELDWYSTRHLDVLRCELVCDSCPVRVPCLAIAMQERDPWELWAGLTVEEREVHVAGHSSVPRHESAICEVRVPLWLTHVGTSDS